MIGRRAIVGLALLCALAFSASAASSASASGTTAFTCVKAEKGSFEDAHCDKEKAGGAFAHQEITPGVATEFELTNAKVKNETTESEPFLLVGELLKAKVEVVCKSAIGTGSLTNQNEGSMSVQGEVSLQVSQCTVTKPSKCTVVEPITYVGKLKSYEKGEEMGIEFVPMGGGKENFTEIIFAGPECAIKGTNAITGSFEGTPGGTPGGKGATLWFTESMGHLQWGSNVYHIVGKLTWQMKGGNAIALTTT